MELVRLQRTSLNLDGIGHFDIACLNVRSLPKHLEDIKMLISFQVEIICLQETWLNKEESSERWSLPNFYLSLNSQGRGKGIATYYNARYSKICDISDEDLQMTKVSSVKVDIINFYRSGNNRTFKNRLNEIVSPDKPTIICGDLNCDINYENPDFFKTLQDLGFEKVNKKPTHDMGRSIDCLFVNSFLKGVTFRQFGVGFSDHDCLLIKFSK